MIILVGDFNEWGSGKDFDVIVKGVIFIKFFVSFFLLCLIVRFDCFVLFFDLIVFGIDVYIV